MVDRKVAIAADSIKSLTLRDLSVNKKAFPEHFQCVNFRRYEYIGKSQVTNKDNEKQYWHKYCPIRDTFYLTLLLLS